MKDWDSEGFLARAGELVSELHWLNEDDRVDAINDLRELIHIYSPFRDEPVDLVKWVPADRVRANDYNPNKVAPPEMELLAHSVNSDGYTQPIVGWEETSGNWTVVDGFHRHRVGKEDPAISARVRGRLPMVTINKGRGGRSDRQAATVRHNRARGEHTVTGMSQLVLDMARNGKTDEWISRELGMDMDEVLRLRQVTGLAEAFKDRAFSEAWSWTEDEE